MRVLQVRLLALLLFLLFGKRRREGLVDVGLQIKIASCDSVRPRFLQRPALREERGEVVVGLIMQRVNLHSVAKQVLAFQLSGQIGQ